MAFMNVSGNKPKIPIYYLMFKMPHDILKLIKAGGSNAKVDQEGNNN